MSNSATLKKRRGVARASITRLTNRLKDLESDPDNPTTLNLAQGMARKLETLDADFRTHHHALVDLIDDEETLSTEQGTLDSHDDFIAELSARIQRLISSCTPSLDHSSRKIASRRLSRLQRSLTSIGTAISSSDESMDVCLLRQYEEELAQCKKELTDVRNSLLSIDLEDDDELSVLQGDLEGKIFDFSLQIKKVLHTSTHTVDSLTADSHSRGVKLPKLDVPTFDGNILHWRTFWEQFCVSVHDRSSLADSEKLVYLQQSLKDGSAKSAIEGLSRSGEYYTEAVECLKARYNRPRLIHQTHVRMILDAPSLRDGTGRELRRLHDTVQQHLRALKAMDYEPSGPFITSVLELKLDINTMFEWQKHTQDSTDVPHYQKLLEFINLRAQASETPTSTQRPTKGSSPTKSVASFAANADDANVHCPLCKNEKHPLYACTRFKALSHDKMLSTLKTNKLCMNCLKPGHFVKQCKSVHHCHKCRKPHHTLLHLEGDPNSQTNPTPTSPPPTKPVSSHAAAGSTPDALLMTCRVLVDSPDGLTMEARALLDSASSASFVSERLAQALCLPRSHRNTKISGVAGISHTAPLRSIATLKVSPRMSPHKKMEISAVVVPQVTCDLPLRPVTYDASWSHLDELPLADPDFGRPGKIDLLLGVDVFVKTLLQGRRVGPSGSPSAFETEFGWVLAGRLDMTDSNQVTSHHVSATDDDLLRRIWEIEEYPNAIDTSLSSPSVLQHFKENHHSSESGRFIVPLPKKPHAKSLGESRSQAVRRFLSLERSLHSKGEFDAFRNVMEEYFQMDHAEPVPTVDLEKPQHEVFYLPMHSVRKESSTTTKIRAVFDASAKSSSGVSLNDILLVGPTVHSSLVDVLLRFQFNRIALTTDVSRMYRAVELTSSDKDLHRFVWRSKPSEELRYYRMTRVTFGVSASSFAANMAVKQNALDLATKYPEATTVVEKSFYVDDGLTGADSIEEARDLQKQLQDLFASGGFLLRKWNSNHPAVLQHLPLELRDDHSTQALPSSEEYTKTLGIEWNTTTDHFRLTISDLPSVDVVTKRILVSDVAKTFDVLGWFSPAIIKVKILMQRTWEFKIDWDDPLPPEIRDIWSQWRSQLKCLSNKHLPRCYFPDGVSIVAVELHGFSDASEDAYAAVVYLRLTDSTGKVHVSIVTSKTKVAPMKRLTIPRLKLCGAHLLSQLLHHVQQVFGMPLNRVFAWTDSTLVLSWLVGNPRRFKTFVGNRVSHIVELISPDRWRHVNGAENPADCASRGLFPAELLEHSLWWDGPNWLKSSSTDWPKSLIRLETGLSDEEREVCLHTNLPRMTPLMSLDRFSNFTRYKYVTAWVLRFIHNCRAHGNPCSPPMFLPLSVQELSVAEGYWVRLSQEDHFLEEIQSLETGHALPRSSCLLSLRPILDQSGLLRVGGRLDNAQMCYSIRHPAILPGKHKITKLIIYSEHLQLLHAGPTLVNSSLSRRYHIIGARKAIYSVTRACTTCRRAGAKPQSQILGQLPKERTQPGFIFENFGVDYAGPVYLKYGHVRKPTVIKAYVCVFVSLSVKAVHLELVSDLTTDAFIATLRRFIARRGKPSMIWSDHGTNFVGAAREIKELITFLEQQVVQGAISKFCSSQNIQWKFIPERAPHFGGLWEAAVKSLKYHLRRVIADTKLTFEEFITILNQVEACLNSRPLTSLPCDSDSVEVLTPGHFLIGKPLESLPDPSTSYRSISLLRRWHLCQSIVRQIWKRWSTEYITNLRRLTKWQYPKRNVKVGDVVMLQEDNLVPTKWPLGRVVEVHVGKDKLVRVVTVKTSNGTYKRPVTKIALLIPSQG